MPVRIVALADDGLTDEETPADRVRAALELTDLAEQMFVQRLLREGATAEEAQQRLQAWRAEPGTHAGDPWFAVRPMHDR